MLHLNLMRPHRVRPVLHGLLWGLGLSTALSLTVVGALAAWDYWYIFIRHQGATIIQSEDGRSTTLLMPISPYAAILGMAPAVLIGLTGGPLVGWLVSRRARSEDNADTMGVFVVGALGVPWFMLGLFTGIGLIFITPAYFYSIILGAWFARRLYRNLHATEETNPENRANPGTAAAARPHP